jgi:hypothetical protein
VALAKNSKLTSLSLWENKVGDEGAKLIAGGLAKNSKLTTLDLSENRIGDEGAKLIAKGLAKNSALTTLHLSTNEFGDEGAKAMAKALAKNSTLTSLDLRENCFGIEGAMAMALALAENTTLTWLLWTSHENGGDADKFIAAHLKRNNRLLREKLEREKARKRSSPTCAELRERYTANGFGALSLDMTSERALVTAAAPREPLHRFAQAVDGVAADWRTVLETQQAVSLDSGEGGDAITRTRDAAVSAFVASSRALEKARSALVELPLVVPRVDKDDSDDAPLLTIVEVDALVASIAEWLARVDVLSDARMTTVTAARDAFVDAHDELGAAIGARCTAAMKEAEAVCLERARAVEDVILKVPAVPRSPLSDMPPAQCARVVTALRAQRSAILREISEYQQHRRELLSHGDACPSTDELKSMRKKLKQASRKVQVLDLEHQHAVEDDEDVAECAAALDNAKSVQRDAARAVDAEWLRLSLASSRWPELRRCLGDDVATARSIAVFDDQVVIAEGPPTTRFKVIRGTAPDGTSVALKLFPLGGKVNDKATTRFMREAERLRRLRFDHVVYVRDVFVHVEGKQRFGVLELQYYGRGDMQQWLASGEPKPTSAQVRSVLRDALLGLAFCHGVGIVHADVKPANIFIGDSGTAVLGDFDVSHDDGVRLTTTVVSGATVAFMAPELRVPGSRATKASDMFAFGTTVDHVRGRLDDDVTRVVSRCTATRPDTRCSAEQALADDFFRGAACRSDQWKGADCIIMAHCGGELQPATAGVHCPSGHFVCTADLEALIASRSDSAEEVQCPDPSCGTREYEVALLASTVSRDAFATWMRGRERRTEATLVAGMEAQYMQQL